MAPPEHDHAAIAVLERYELLHKIATGGMAEVFLAKAYGAHGFEKRIAIKRILPNLAQSRRFEKRFIAEAKITAELTHANIVQVLDFGRWGGSLFIAMEYIDGPNLDELARAHAERGLPVPLGAILYTATEVCKGLDFAHERGVVHRDISPSNVLLSSAGEVKIGDFGIARAVDARTTHSHGLVMGKWRYMSPEQSRGESLDARSDLFSLGVVLHQLTTGRHLFSGRNIDEIVASIQSGPVTPPSQERPDVPAVLDEVVLRLLERDRGDRYQNATDAVRDLTRVCYSLGIVPTRKDVTELLEDLANPAGDETIRMHALPHAATPGPNDVRNPDAVLESELRMAGVGADSDVGPRVTVVTTGGAAGAGAGQPWPGAGGGAPDTASDHGDFPASTTGFIRRGRGPDGLTVWEPAASGHVAMDEAETLHRPVLPADDRARRSPILWLAVTLATAAVIAAGVFLAWPHDDGETVAAVSVSQPKNQPTPASPDSPSGEPEPGSSGDRSGDVPTGADIAVTSDRTPDAAAQAAQDRAPPPVLPDAGVAGEPTPPRHKERTRPKKKPPKKTRYGTIDLNVVPWAYVYFRGRRIAETPAIGLRLPVGEHRLKLVNTELGKEKTVKVTVPGKRPYRFSLRD